MSKVAVFFATGYEEVEALTAVDLLRRAGVEVNMVSITGDLVVTGTHQIPIQMNSLFEDVDFSEYDMLVLPGGMPGTRNLEAYEPLMEQLRCFLEQDKYIAAICAAPTVFGHAGFLKDQNACCYPGMEDGLLGAKASTNEVEVAGKIITSRGLGTAIPFGLTLVEILTDRKTAEELGKKIVYKQN